MALIVDLRDPVAVTGGGIEREIDIEPGGPVGTGRRSPSGRQRWHDWTRWSRGCASGGWTCASTSAGSACSGTRAVNRCAAGVVIDQDDPDDGPRTLLDKAATLVGQGHDSAAFGHVVVDEAQELSEMAWRMLMRRCPTRSMTVVGDLAQTGNPAGASSWDRVLRPHVRDRWELARLTVNYRTPAEIMDATADLLAAHHPGTPPSRSVRSTGETPWRIGTTRADLPTLIADLATAHTDGQLAIIAPSAHLESLAAARPLATPPDLTGKVVLLTPDQAKGLEFDSVLIAELSAIPELRPDPITPANRSVRW